MVKLGVAVLLGIDAAVLAIAAAVRWCGAAFGSLRMRGGRIRV